MIARFFSVTVDELLSPDELLSGTQETQTEKAPRFYNLAYGLLDGSMAMLLFLPVFGEKTADMNEKALSLYRRKHLGYIFQMYNLIPNLNIKENVEVGAYLSENPLDVDEILKILGLYEHRHKLPNQLSGGQQQRTAIGRAIVKNPDILLYRRKHILKNALLHSFCLLLTEKNRRKLRRLLF